MIAVPETTERPIQKVRRISASQQIYQSLRERILSLELKPGMALSRVEISEDYGVSQTPVREAMQRLEDEGLLFVLPQSRTEVSKIDIVQAKEAQFLRLSVEVEIAKALAGTAAKLSFKQQNNLLAQAQSALDAGDILQFKILDAEFHRSLYQMLGVEALWRLVSDRSGHIDRLRSLSLMDAGKGAAILIDHKAILDAITAGNPNAAEAATRKHLSGTLSQVDLLKQQFTQYF